MIPEFFRPRDLEGHCVPIMDVVLLVTMFARFGISPASPSIHSVSWGCGSRRRRDGWFGYVEGHLRERAVGL